MNCAFQHPVSCSKGHPEICFEGQVCPCCKLQKRIEVLKDGFENLTLEIKDLFTRMKIEVLKDGFENLTLEIKDLFTRMKKEG